MADVEFEKVGRVAMVRLNRPSALNAINSSVMHSLAEIFTAIQEDPSVSVAVLTGTGRSFCVGLDLKEHAASVRKTLDYPDLEGRPSPFFPERSLELTTPIICAVNGFAFGGGFFLFANADLAIAGESAAFEISEVPLGLVAGWDQGLRFGLPRSAAMELAFGLRIDARRAYDMGLVNEVVPDDRLLDRAMERAQQLAAMPPLVLRFQQELVNRLQASVPADVDTRMNELAAVARASQDAQEARRAFAERRTPVFVGR